MYQPPTDSLYKFCALSGIVIAFFSIYYPLTRLADLRSKQNTIARETEATIARLEYLKSQGDFISRIVSDLIAQQRDEYVPDSNKLALNYSDSEIKAMISRQLEMTRDAQISTSSILISHQETKDLLADIKRWRWIFGMGSGSGFVLAGFGFYLWYRRIQVHQDRILAVASKAPKDIESTNG